MIAAAYIRVSTEDQIEFSPDSQLKRIREYAKQHDIQIPDAYVFIDEGISGRTASKRPAFQKMIALAKQDRPFQQILVWKFSRFARNRQDSIFYKSMLRRDCGIDVISITEPLSADPTSILIEALLEAMDEYYSINLAQEVKRGMQERFSRGRPISIPPFGYRISAGEFVPEPTEAHWVSFIFEEYVRGKPPGTIAASLNQKGVRTIRGNHFDARGITYILHNPVYIGKLRKQPAFPHSPVSEPMTYDRYYLKKEMEWIDGIHVPLISEVLWEQAQRREPADFHQQKAIADTQTGRTTSGNSSTEYFLKNVVACSNCGRKLVHIQKGRSFQCGGYNHGLCKCSHYVKASDLESLVWNAITPILSPEEILLLKNPSLTPKEKNHFLRTLPIQMVYQKHEKRILCLSDSVSL